MDIGKNTKFTMTIGTVATLFVAGWWANANIATITFVKSADETIAAQVIAGDANVIHQQNIEDLRLRLRIAKQELLYLQSLKNPTARDRSDIRLREAEIQELTNRLTRSASS